MANDKRSGRRENRVEIWDLGFLLFTPLGQYPFRLLLLFARFAGASRACRYVRSVAVLSLDVLYVRSIYRSACKCGCRELSTW